MKISTKQKIENLIYSDAPYHLIFWVVFYFFLVLVSPKDLSLSNNLSKNFIHVCFYALIVYVNLFWLIPDYLSKNKIVQYLIYLTISVLTISLLKLLFLYSLHSYRLDLSVYFQRHGLSVALISFFVGFASTIFIIINDWFLHKSERVDLQRQSLKSELKFLKSQINPHFLFNTLNSLYALTLKKSDQAPDIVLRLAEMMRYMLYECNETYVPLHKEVNYIKNYLELERVRHSGKFEMNFSIKGDPKLEKVTPLIFIPFIENSFKHGLNSNISSGFVHIDLKINGSLVDFTIENSKSPTLPSIHHKKSGGIGLINVKRRLNILYQEKYTLKIIESPNTYTVKLNLNLEN